MRTTKSSPSRSSLQGVNDLLRTLRGEQFRHAQNARRSQARAPHVSVSVHTPSLPILPVMPVGATAGPELPRSLTASRDSEERSGHWEGTCGRSWRAHVLSIVLDMAQVSIMPDIPPLTLLCMRRLLLFTTTEFATDVVPFPPHHLRRDLMRYTAVNAPLSNSLLHALCGPEGHACGELIVIGPEATLRRNMLSHYETSQAVQSKVLSDWDSMINQDDSLCPPLLHTLVLVSSFILPSTFLAFPPTLTRLALVNLSKPFPIYRLPDICPLLVVLDLSYNSWFSAAALYRVAWPRWTHLEILGLRGLEWSEELSNAINQERWVEIQIIH